MRPCPSEFELTRAVDGSTSISLIRHVEDCESCRARIQDLVDRPAAPPLMLPGYRVLEEVGRGATGVVYRAVQESVDREVALKLMWIGACSLDQRLREARILGRVRHPNIVSIHEVGQVGDRVYLVLEYIPGGTLKHHIDRVASPGEAARWVRTIAAAVDHIHKQGILHLDLKPSNVLVRLDAQSWELKVTDFGNASSVSPEDGTWTAGPRGTPSYMAPELVAGGTESPGAAADVYSIGAILYEALAGRPPFLGNSQHDTYAQVRRFSLSPPSTFNPLIPRDLETICLKCLAREPADRYSSAAAIADDLTRWSEGWPIRARRTSRWEHTIRWARRKPFIAGLAALSAISSIGMSIALIWGTAESRRGEESDRRAQHNAEISRATSHALMKLMGHPLLDDGHPDPDARHELLERVRGRLVAAWKEGGIDEGNLETLANIDMLLSRIYSNRADGLDLSRARVREAVDIFHQFDRDSIGHETSGATWILAVAKQARSEMEQAAWDTETPKLLAEFDSLRRSTPTDLIDTSAAVWASSARILLSDYLHERGDESASNRVILANKDALAAPWRPGYHDAVLMLHRARVCSDLGDEANAHEYVRPVVDSVISRGESGHFESMSFWLLRRNGAEARLVKLLLDVECPRRPEDLATELFEVLRAEQLEFGIKSGLFGYLYEHTHRRFAELGTRYRRLGRLREAGALAGRYLEFSQRVVELAPLGSASYAFQSGALEQSAKNAMQSGDEPEVLRLLSMSEEFARRALAVNPENPRWISLAARQEYRLVQRRDGMP